MLALSAALAWLGWRLLQQDRQLAVQRLVEQRETAADLAVAALDRRFAEVEDDLNRALVEGDLKRHPRAAEDSVSVEFLPRALRAWPPDRLTYYPEVPEAHEVSASLFAAADELEFHRGDHAGALERLRNLTRSGDPQIRAAALARTARNYLKRGDVQRAMQNYAQLRELGSVPIGGMPAALAADAGALALYEQQNDRSAIANAAAVLYRDANSGKWPIARAAYHDLAERALSHLPSCGDSNNTAPFGRGSETLAEPRPEGAVLPAVAYDNFCNLVLDGKEPFPRGLPLAEAVDWLYDRWKTGSAAAMTGGRTSIPTRSGPVLLIWRMSGGRLVLFAGGPQYVQNHWLKDLIPLLEARDATLALTGTDGRAVMGAVPDRGSRPAIRLASSTQLPWTVQVFNAGDGRAPGPIRLRGELLIAGIGLLVLVILTASWFIARAVTRELEVARLQSDFVSAVSHEFRTPLTTLYQLSELLKRGRVAAESDRQEYYELLYQESDRLRRLVESVLHFGRIESGKMQFRFETVDAAGLLTEAVTEFAQAQQPRAPRFEVETAADDTLIRADREALRCVLWNLFDNAVKYSPGCDTVWVGLARNGRQAQIAVRDRGMGIPRTEQRQIFDKFVRGAAARDNHIRGTGIGLATALQIVRAHGGDIAVESEPGAGSTFRVLLPLAERI